MLLYLNVIQALHSKIYKKIETRKAEERSNWLFLNVERGRLNLYFYYEQKQQTAFHLFKYIHNTYAKKKSYKRRDEQKRRADCMRRQREGALVGNKVQNLNPSLDEPLL